MKKVLLINTSGLGVGGITSHMLNYISLLNNKYEFTVIATVFYEEDVIEKLKKLGCNVIRLSHRKKFLIKYYFELKELIKNGEFDIVHVHGNSATMLLELSLGKKYGVKTRIAHCHNSICGHKTLHTILRKPFKKSYTDAIACSKMAGDWIYGVDNFSILTNGIDVEKYKYSKYVREEFRKEWGISENTILFGCVGNLIEQKNQEFILPVLKMTSEHCKLVIIGEGEKRGRILETINALGLENRVTLFPYRNDVDKCIQAFDGLLMPSKWEGLPMILVEAQAAGLPCMVSEYVSSEASIVDNIFKKIPLDEEEWRSAIKSFVLNSNRENAYKTVRTKGFDMKECVTMLEKIYQ